MDAQKMWETTSEKLKSFIRTRVRNEMDTEDILHDVFLRFRNYEHTIKDHKNVRAWLFAVTRNTIADFYKNRDSTYSITEANHTSDDDNHYIFSNCVEAFINTLPQKYAEALWLSEIEGLSQKEVAQRLGISYSGAKSRIQRGKLKLKEQLLACCDVQTDKYGTILDFERRKN